MRKKTRKIIGLLLATAVLGLTGCNAGTVPEETESEPVMSETYGEDYSQLFTEPFEIVCPWVEGGSSDINARTIGQVIGEMTGQTVMITNRTGQGGALGFAEQKNAEPDGYHLGIVTAELNTLPPQGKVDFDQSDFYPIIRMNTVPACIAVAKDAPYESLDEMISYAREHPGELRTGNVGKGSIWHICAAKLEREAGITLKHNSYDGAAEAAEALAAGKLDMVTVETAVMQNYVETGQAKILAVMAEERLRSFPEYPTCKELGFTVVGGSFQGIVCPVDVPQEVKDSLESLFTEAFYSESYQSFCEQYGLERSFLNSADFRTFLEENQEEIENIMSDLKLAG